MRHRCGDSDGRRGGGLRLRTSHLKRPIHISRARARGVGAKRGTASAPSMIGARMQAAASTHGRGCATTAAAPSSRAPPAQMTRPLTLGWPLAVAGRLPCGAGCSSAVTAPRGRGRKE